MGIRGRKIHFVITYFESSGVGAGEWCRGDNVFWKTLREVCPKFGWKLEQFGQDFQLVSVLDRAPATSKIIIPHLCVSFFPSHSLTNGEMIN